MENLVFTQLTIPEVKQLFRQELEIYFANEKQSIKSQPETTQWFDLSELCEYHPDKPSKPTVYGWISQNKIPHHKGAKKLRFLKSEIDTWLKQDRKQTLAEIEQETDNYLSKKKGGKNA